MHVVSKQKLARLPKHRKNGNRRTNDVLSKQAEQIVQLLHDAQFDTGKKTDSVALVRSDRR